MENRKIQSYIEWIWYAEILSSIVIVIIFNGETNLCLGSIPLTILIKI